MNDKPIRRTLADSMPNLLHDVGASPLERTASEQTPDPQREGQDQPTGQTQPTYGGPIVGHIPITSNPGRFAGSGISYGDTATPLEYRKDKE